MGIVIALAIGAMLFAGVINLQNITDTNGAFGGFRARSEAPETLRAEVYGANLAYYHASAMRWRVLHGGFVGDVPETEMDLSPSYRKVQPWVSRIDGTGLMITTSETTISQAAGYALGDGAARGAMWSNLAGFAHGGQLISGRNGTQAIPLPGWVPEGNPLRVMQFER